MPSNGHIANGANGNGTAYHIRVEGDGEWSNSKERTADGTKLTSTLTENGHQGKGDPSESNGHNGSWSDSGSTVTGEISNGEIRNSSDVMEKGHAELEEGTTGKLDAGGARRLDEYDVDFKDTRRFAMRRWEDLLNSTARRLLPSDLAIASKYRDREDLSTEIHLKMTDHASTDPVKRNMSRIQQVPIVFGKLFHKFSTLVSPFEVKFDLVWGLIYLNLKLSYASTERLNRTVDLLIRIRRVIDLFNRCLQGCEEDNESRIAVVDFLDPLMILLTESITYLRDCPSDKKANSAWPAMKDTIDDQMYKLEQTVKYVNDITSFSTVNQESKVQNLFLRHAIKAEPEEHGTFPNRILPTREENPRFYGRTKELQDMTDYLNPKGDQSFRSYTIYGRRGVGKTEIALQFANTNPCNFDAIFWIECETSVAIRKSFTKVAVSLNLPGADSDGHHEENLLKVHDWLKKTKKRWLLIFDNAERDSILKQYWPVGGSGAILVTTRKYYNFVKDVLRRGTTITPFTPEQSWDLLLNLLGDDWKKLDRENRIEPSEAAAARALLEKLGGLALAIQQAAQLIKNTEIGGPTVAKTYETFERRLRTLPERHSMPRSETEKPLDALWDMIFKALTPNARVLLSVLAWLSPDGIQTQLFLPRNQTILDGPLSWCKQETIDEKQRATLYNLITPTQSFEDAINELLTKDLIKQIGPRLFSVHRVVQEAINYQNSDELQKTFETAARLVFEQFPNRRRDDSLFNRWSTCQDYIQHGVQLSRKFELYGPNLKGTAEFVELLSNCAWYLHELGDYETSSKILETAKLACADKISLAYAELRNIAGCRFYELNRLSDCRVAWEECKTIRTDRLPHNDILIAAIFNNLGNLELAQGNTQDAMECFNRATQIWVDGGDAVASRLALTYLCVGRVRMLQGKLAEALELTEWSEDLFVRTTGRERGFMANVHYAYGNIHRRQNKYEAAWRDYDSCLKICLLNMSIHPITSAAYYSLGCLEALMGHPDSAKTFLEKSRTISELRSPDRDDGPITRAVWQTACVLESDPYNSFAKEASELRRRAEVAQRKLLAEGEGGFVPRLEGDTEETEEKYGFDSLVPLFFR